MSTTTALQLLRLADLHTRRLRESTLPATPAQWESFDVTLHRLLLELIGSNGSHLAKEDPSRAALTLAARIYPHPLRYPLNTHVRTDEASDYLDVNKRTLRKYIHGGRLRVVRDERNDLLVPTADLDDRPDIRPADPLDRHPLAKTSCALGAMAGLIRDSHVHGPVILQGHGEIAGATEHVLTLAAVAARHSMSHGPAEDAVRPLVIGRYAERVIDRLRDLSLDPVSLNQLAAVLPQPQPTTLPDQLEGAIETWGRCTREELGRLIPSVDVLRQIANQGAHLCAARLRLDVGLDDQRASELQRAQQSLALAETAWGRTTTLTRPSHEFVTASRELYETLTPVGQEARHPSTNPERAAAHLDRGISVVGDLMAAIRTMPDRLLAANIMRAPATTIRSTADRLTPRGKGRYIYVRAADLPDLQPAWQDAATALGRMQLQADRAAETTPVWL